MMHALHPRPHPLATGMEASRMTGQTFTICSAFCIVTIPVVLLNAILIGITAKYAEPGSLKALRTAVLVNIDAARFATISSWSSTLASIISPFLIILASYPSSQCILQSVRNGAYTHLPTPYQLATMLEIRTGSTFASLWRLIKYHTSYRKTRPAMGRSLQMMINALILGLVLSVLVFITDTWLHLTITSENIFHYSSSSGVNLSFSLLPRCLLDNNSYSAQSAHYRVGVTTEACTLNPAASNTFLLESPIDPTRVINNLSTIAVVKRHTQEGRTYLYLAPADTSNNIRQDYTARTYGMSSKCSPRSKICNLGDGMYGAATPFNCTGSDFADSIKRWINLQYYSDEDLSSSSFSNSNRGFPNPFYFIGAVNLPSQWPTPPNDPEIIKQVHGDYCMMMNCSTNVYDIAYSVANGSVIDFAATKSNGSVTNALQSSIGYTTAAENLLQQAFSSAGFSGSAQGVLDLWAPEYDRAAMSMSTTALQGSAAMESQYRDLFIVARLPLAPFICLLTANMLFALFGTALAMLAIWAGRDPETQEVVERVTAIGVIANYFETPQQARGPVDKPEMMFDELAQGRERRVTIERAEEGGFKFMTRG